MFDLVSNPLYNAMVISGHFDKQVRLWDITSGAFVRAVELNGRVTSLSLAAGR